MKIKNYFFLLLILLSASSCQKSGTSPEEKKEDTISNADVYVGGRLGNFAVYWKNNELHQVNSTDGTSQANAIAVQGNDVYLSGYSVNSSGESIITYWKNGVPTFLSNLGFSTSYNFTGIAVKGSDVFVAGTGAGTTHPIATLWKNGVATDLSNGLSSHANAIAIANNGDLYIAGNSDGRACYWKNGSIIYLGEENTLSEIRAICISGADVYLAGYSYDGYSFGGSGRPSPVYWKNGIKTTLPINGEAGSLKATSITTNGSDVYIVGSGLFNATPTNAYVRALYWKNGTFNDISAASTGNYSANAIAVSGTDIYIGVAIENKGYLLKNNVPVTLNTGGSPYVSCNAICIVNK